MPKVKVRWALVQYPNPTKNNPHAVSFGYRGETLDLSEEILADLPPGSYVDGRKELDRPGVLMALREAPTDEELLAWVASASTTEVDSLLRERPNIAPRLVAMQDRVQAIFEARSDAISDAADRAESVLRDAGLHGVPVAGGSAMLGTAGQPADSGSGTDAATTTGDEGTEETGGDEGILEPRVVVAGDGDDVAAYVADHPDQAQAILEAEEASRGGRARAAVRRAVEAAAGHTS